MPPSYELHLILPLTRSYLNIPPLSTFSSLCTTTQKNLKKHPGCNVTRCCSFQRHLSSRQIASLINALYTQQVLSVRVHPSCSGFDACTALSPICSRRTHQILRDTLRARELPSCTLLMREKRCRLGKWVAVTNEAEDSQSLNVVWMLIAPQRRVGVICFL